MYCGELPEMIQPLLPTGMNTPSLNGWLEADDDVAMDREDNTGAMTDASRVPSASPARLPAAGAAVLVLDMTASAAGPTPVHETILPALGAFLDRARSAGVPIIFTGARTNLGQPV